MDAGFFFLIGGGVGGDGVNFSMTRLLINSPLLFGNSELPTLPDFPGISRISAPSPGIPELPFFSRKELK